MHGGPTAYHRDAVELRFVDGGFGVPGPGIAWVRLWPLIAGEVTAGLATLFAAADFGSALAQPFSRDSDIALIKVDVTVALHRAPIGPWIRLHSNGRLDPGGVGLAMTDLADVAGPVGAATQAQTGYRRPGQRR